VAGGKGLTFLENFPIGQVVLFGLLAFGCVCRGTFGRGRRCLWSITLISTSPALFYRYWGTGLDGCKLSTLDDVYYK